MSELLELQLRRSADKVDKDADSTIWKSLIQNVLRVITEVTRESESKDTIELRDQITECRNAFGRQLHPQEERQMAAACVKSCEQYLKRVQLDQAARETELLEMVAILREAATRFLGDSTDFNARLLSSADRLRMMTKLDDLRDLKNQLTLEVSSLERVVEDKKQRDDAAIRKLSERVTDLQADLVKAEEEASVDAVTKIPNRGAFDKAMKRMVEAAKKSGSSFTIAMFDVDHFKEINDSHGHLVGDRVLLCTAEWLRNSIRHTDFVARFGGDEFVVALTDADLKNAEQRLGQVLEEIAGRSYEYEVDGQQQSVRFTVSCGLTQLTPQDSETDLIQRADQALYQAKQKGRNHVVSKKASRFARLFSHS